MLSVIYAQSIAIQSIVLSVIKLNANKLNVMATKVQLESIIRHHPSNPENGPML